MNIRKSDDGFYVSGQICVADLPAIAAAGIRTLVCNRPDGEAEGQPDCALVQQAAAEYGMNVHYIPVTTAGITQDNLQDMIAVLSTAERPLLAYCQSGKRSDIIHSLAKKSMQKSTPPLYDKKK